MRVYDFHYNYNSKFFLGIFLLLILISIGVILFFYNNRRIFKVIIIVIFMMLFLIVLSTSYLYPYTKYKEIQKAIDKDEILYVSGEVVDFYTPKLTFGGHECESFKINNIEFRYYDNESYGYSLSSNKNKVIFQNGQNLKIGYYEEYDYYDKSSPSRRVIVCIEILEDDLNSSE